MYGLETLIRVNVQALIRRQRRIDTQHRADNQAVENEAARIAKSKEKR